MIYHPIPHKAGFRVVNIGGSRRAWVRRTTDPACFCGSYQVICTEDGQAEAADDGRVWRVAHGDDAGGLVEIETRYTLAEAVEAVARVPSPADVYAWGCSRSFPNIEGAIAAAEKHARGNELMDMADDEGEKEEEE